MPLLVESYATAVVGHGRQEKSRSQCWAFEQKLAKSQASLRLILPRMTAISKPKALEFYGAFPNKRQTSMLHLAPFSDGNAVIYTRIAMYPGFFARDYCQKLQAKNEPVEKCVLGLADAGSPEL